MSRAFIGVGSNVRPVENVRKALELLIRQVRIREVSTVYLTEALGRPEQPPYYNCVVEIETELPPLVLKQSVLRRVEEELGRSRGRDEFAPRAIDLDLILYDDVVMQTSELVLPDPDIPDRPFLAIPLHELIPDLILPGSGERIEDVVRRLPRAKMKALAEYTAVLRRVVG